MSVFNHVLVPTDFGEPAQRAVDLAIALAPKFEANVTLLHASWLPVTAAISYGAGLPWPTDAYLEQAEKELDALASRARERYPKIDAYAVEGEPWEEILRGALQHHADLIVMGTHGRRGLSRALLGSVAERVVRLSPVPVLTISGRAEEEAKRGALHPAAASTGHSRP